MKLITNPILLMFTAFLLLFCSVSISAQMDEYEKAKMEIESTFGTFPTMFDAFPKYALPGAWKSFKTLTGPEANIPKKYQQLIQLGVSAQIPCEYCVFFHTESAKAAGATNEEIHEAVALAAETRHWSTILNGNQIEFQAFKKEFKDMMDYMVKNKEGN